MIKKIKFENTQNDGFLLLNTLIMHNVKTTDEEHCNSSPELVFDERL